MSSQGPCFPKLYSCDTFVALPPGTAHSCVVFGKNSDRPHDEVQEVVYIPATDHCCPAKLKCTYIEVEQVTHTYAVILSKPAWMWGAEMGSNEHGVCIGNEAVWTKLNGPDDAVKSLLGMDLLRLGLERSATASEALHVIVSLLESHGQGGNCSDTISDFTYHNSFLIADRLEAWVLETAGKLWAAEKITEGVRNISNELSISTKIDLFSSNLKHHAEENGFWDPSEGPLNFKKAYSLDEDETESYRYKCGKHLLTKFSLSGNFKEEDMFKILRDKPSGICMSSGSFISTGSQVSVLPPLHSTQTCCHWFTATPDPYQSVFKPFIFTDCIDFSNHVISPTISVNDDSLKVKNYFEEKVDRQHELFRLHGNALLKNKRSPETLRSAKLNLEKVFVAKIETMMSDYTSSQKLFPNNLFKCAVEEEVKLYE